jgi:hypothetical protein
MNPFHSPDRSSGTGRPQGADGAERAGDFEARLRQIYLRADKPLDAATAGRLRAARRTALQAGGRSSAHTLQRRWLPAGAFAVLALATLAIWQPADHHAATPPQAAAQPTTPETDADLPPDADSAEDAQLYQNLAFYDWLAAADHTPARR